MQALSHLQALPPPPSLSTTTTINETDISIIQMCIWPYVHMRMQILQDGGLGGLYRFGRLYIPQHMQVRASLSFLATVQISVFCKHSDDTATTCTLVDWEAFVGENLMPDCLALAAPVLACSLVSSASARFGGWTQSSHLHSQGPSGDQSRNLSAASGRHSQFHHTNMLGTPEVQIWFGFRVSTK
jgi:hypothetical protein